MTRVLRILKEERTPLPTPLAAFLDALTAPRRVTKAVRPRATVKPTNDAARRVVRMMEEMK